MRNWLGFGYVLVWAVCVTGLVSDVFAVSIRPTRHALLVDPGGQKYVTLLVENDSDEPKVFTPDVDAFTIEEKTGVAHFGEDEEAITWVSGEPAQLSLDPGEGGEFTFFVSVPERAEVRSRYLGLFAQEVAGVGQVGIGTRVGSLLFLHIGGQAHEHVVVTSFTSTKSLVTGDGLSLLLTLQNVGTIHAVPKGEVVIHVGDRVLGRYSVNEKNRKVLPDGVWQESYVLDGLTIKDTGKITAEVSGEYGVSDQQFSRATTLYYLPWPIVITTILFFIVVLIVTMRFRLKKVYKKKS